MKTAAVIAEYNPFHNGHAYQIARTKELTGADYVLVLMSGDFVQRGEAAFFSKHARAEAACRCGADIVIELPLPWSISSAETFASGAVDILSAMGFYQAEPGSGRYWFGSPIVDKAEICTENGTFRIVVENNSEDNKYIQSVELNGKTYDKGYIEHKDIAAGGTLTIRMGQEKKIWY